MARGRGSNGGDVVLFAMPGAQGGLLGIDASSLGGGGSNAGAPTGSRAQTGRPLSGERLRRRQAAQEELVTYFKQAAAAAERASAARPGSGGAASADGARGSDAAAVPRAADGETDGDSDTECPICLEPLSAGQARAPYAACAAPCAHLSRCACAHAFMPPAGALGLHVRPPHGTPAAPTPPGRSPRRAAAHVHPSECSCAVC
jgi:hypothetical protein